MPALLEAYAALRPELVVSVGAILLLMAGVFLPVGIPSSRRVTWAAVAVLIVAIVVLVKFSPDARLFNGAFILDAFARAMKLLILVGAAVALVLSIDDLSDAKALSFEFPVLVLLSTVGMLIMASAGDLIALYLSLELQSLALYVVAAYQRDNLRSSEAGMKYFVLGALSSGMLLYGASLIYGITGSTNFAEIAKVATLSGVSSYGMIFGLVFLLAGLAFKISAVPFHMWTPDVYEGSPTPVTALFSSAPKVAAIALIARVMVSGLPNLAFDWQQIIVFLSIASMVLGALGAIGQRNIKRLMAYSSIANMGFALVGLSAGTSDGILGIVVYMAIYVVTSLGAFAAILSMRRASGAVEEIDELSGLAQTNLPMATAIGVLMFSLAGIPILAGFFAKLYVFLPAIKLGGAFTYLAVIGVVASVIGAYYYLRIVKIMFFDPPREQFLPVRFNDGLVLALAAVFVVAFAIVPSWVVDWATTAARALIT